MASLSRKKGKSERQKLIAKLDKTCGLLVKTLAGWKCERCGRQYPEGTGVQWSHWFGRRKFSVRWDLSNTFAHCPGCHMHLSSQPDEFAQWATRVLGEKRAELVRWKASRPANFKTSDLICLLSDLNHKLGKAEVMAGLARHPYRGEA